MGGERLQSLQAIRGLAFIMIFLSHVELTATGPMGVSIFLVLSGFCMTYAYLDKPEKTPTPGFVNNLKFSWGKVKKLYPLHIVTLLFIAFIVFAKLALHKASREELLYQVGYFIANGLLLQSWIPWREGYFSFNAVSWYLSTAAFSYFLFPWIFWVIQSKDKKRITRLVGFMIGLMVVIAIILSIGREYCGLPRDIIKWGVYICPLYRAGDFILGLVIGYFFVTIKNSGGGWKTDTVAEVVVILLIVGQVAIYGTGNGHTNWTLTLFWLPMSLSCVYLFALNRGMVSMALSRNKALVWIGNISGEAFLIHQICIKAVEVVTNHKWIVAGISFVLTLICTVIWHGFLYRCKWIADNQEHKRG